jgi:hypothetical protein
VVLLCVSDRIFQPGLGPVTCHGVVRKGPADPIGVSAKGERWETRRRRRPEGCCCVSDLCLVQLLHIAFLVSKALAQDQPLNGISFHFLDTGKEGCVGIEILAVSRLRFLSATNRPEEPGDIPKREAKARKQRS